MTYKTKKKKKKMTLWKKTQNRRVLHYGEEFLLKEDKATLQNLCPIACFLQSRCGDPEFHINKETDEQQQLLLEMHLADTEKWWKRTDQPIGYIINSPTM